MGTVRTSYPRFRREGDAPRLEFTEDDITILRRVFRHRFIRAADLYRLFPERSADRLSRRLTQLYRAGFLDRPLSQIDYFRGAGSQSLVYGLDAAGARFLAEECGLSLSSGDWKSRNRSYTRDSLDHTLSVTSFLVDLELACAERSGVELISYDEVLAIAPLRGGRDARPDRWSVPLRAAAATAHVHLIPDAIFGLRKVVDGQAARSFAFLEVDRGTMTIVPAKSVQESEAFLYRSTILRKLFAYAESYRLDLHRKQFGIPSARVLFLTTSAGRAEAMRQAAERFVLHPLHVPPGLFLFGAVENLSLKPLEGWCDISGAPAALA